MFKLRENNKNMAEDRILSKEDVITKITTPKSIKNQDIKNSKLNLTSITKKSYKKRRDEIDIPLIIPIQLNNKLSIKLTPTKIPTPTKLQTTTPPTSPIITTTIPSTSKSYQLKNELKLKEQNIEKFINNNNLNSKNKKIIKKNNNENQLPIKIEQDQQHQHQQQQQQQQQSLENSINEKKIFKLISNNCILSPKNLFINSNKEMTSPTTTITSPTSNPIDTSSITINNQQQQNNYRNYKTGQSILKAMIKSPKSFKKYNNCNNGIGDNNINDQSTSSSSSSSLFLQYNKDKIKNQINNDINEKIDEENQLIDKYNNDDDEEGYDDEVINSSLESTINIELNNFDNDHKNNDNNYDDHGCSSSCGDNNINNMKLDDNKMRKSFCYCHNNDGCITLKDILSVFNAPISEDQAWSLIFQYVKLYRDWIKLNIYHFKDLRIPYEINNLSLHNDGTVHINCGDTDEENCIVTSQKKILMQIGRMIFNALDYNLQQDEECLMSEELEELISFMTFDDDEGIERDAEDCNEEKCIDTKELDDVLQICIPRVKPSVPEDHYKAVCRALVTEALELRIFLQKVFHGDTESLRIKADAVTSKQEFDKLEFNDWARFWMQVVDELRRGVRLKKIDNSRTPVEYELTPYEILMGDIREKKYNLRKVMVNGDIPPRVKKDAHAVILEFIRSRPPLKKASERKLPPPIVISPSPREKLMDSIRQGRSLKPIGSPSTLKNRLLPQQPSSHQIENFKRDEKMTKSFDHNSPKTLDQAHQSPKTKQRLIKVDFSLLRDEDDDILGEPSGSTTSNLNQSICSQPIMPAYPITGYNNENNPNNMNRVLRRTKNTITQDEYHRFFDNALESYDLATQCESRRASMRRHTIVGCQSHLKNETHSVPPSRPDSRQSNEHSKPPISSTYTNSNSKKSQQNSSSQLQQHHQHSLGQQHHQMHNNNNVINNNVNNNHNNSSTSNLTTMETWMKNSLDEHQWSDKISDRLSLTLEEIVHIRSVMTKAELEGLPVGVHVKEDVERRKVCFLCLKTRFSIFGSWGIQCKLCQRTVCSKCYTKMRIPTEHFRNVPVVLLSPSLMGSPAGSSTPSPSHHYGVSGGGGGGVCSSGHGINSTILDESFPKTLMERLLRSESDRKTRNTVGSAPSSPKNQRSNMSTPGSCAHIETSATAGTINRSHLTGIDDTKTNHNNILLNVNGCNKENNSTSLINGGGVSGSCAPNRQVAGIMSRSMEGPRSLPMQSPGRPHSNSSTLDRKNRFARAFTLSSSAHLTSDQKDNLRGEMMAVCNDCRCLVLEIIRSSRQTRSTARNRALKNLTLDISPVYKD